MNKCHFLICLRFHTLSGSSKRICRMLRKWKGVLSVRSIHFPARKQEEAFVLYAILHEGREELLREFLWRDARAFALLSPSALPSPSSFIFQGKAFLTLQGRCGNVYSLIHFAIP